jgi:hypothetical protein
LGIKTEAIARHVDTQKGGRTEILGGFFRDHKVLAGDAVPYFSTADESLSATYLGLKEKVSQYIADWLEWGRKMREEQRKNPPLAVERLRKLRAEMKAKQEANDTEIFG